MLALADTVGSATLVADILTVCAVVIVDGALYSPLLTVPTCGETVHTTPVLEVPPIAAENCCDCPLPRAIELGDNEIVTFGVAVGFSETLVDALVAIPPTTAVAVTVTTGSLFCRPRPLTGTIVAGAV